MDPILAAAELLDMLVDPDFRLASHAYIYRDEAESVAAALRAIGGIPPREPDTSEQVERDAERLAFIAARHGMALFHMLTGKDLMGWQDKETRLTRIREAVDSHPDWATPRIGDPDGHDAAGLRSGGLG